MELVYLMLILQMQYGSCNANYVTVTGLTAYYGFGTTDLRYPVHVDDQATNLVKTRCQQVANGGGYADSANVLLAVFGD